MVQFAAKKRYYHESDVADHDQASDLWVSCHGKVYDLTSIVAEHKKNKCDATKPFEDHAGDDVSHLFEADGNGNLTPKFAYDEALVAWWNDSKYAIGSLSTTTTKVRIVNTLTHQSDTLEVPVEETVEEIQNRYEAFNANCRSYVWKALRTDLRAGQFKDFAPLDTSKTLAENGMKNYDPELKLQDLDPDNFTQAIHLYFADDLSCA